MRHKPADETHNPWQEPQISRHGTQRTRRPKRTTPAATAVARLRHGATRGRSAAAASASAVTLRGSRMAPRRVAEIRYTVRMGRERAIDFEESFAIPPDASTYGGFERW